LGTAPEYPAATSISLFLNSNLNSPHPLSYKKSGGGGERKKGGRNEEFGSAAYTGSPPKRKIFPTQLSFFLSLQEEGKERKTDKKIEAGERRRRVQISPRHSGFVLSNLSLKGEKKRKGGEGRMFIPTNSPI